MAQDARKSKSGGKDKNKGKAKGTTQGRTAAPDNKSGAGKAEDWKNVPGEQS
ncbi:hypothetical protein MF672_018550 [Actinomadura sp. ATCC 31491]|uniref:Uncharacterized protein n=1 Tax=Actinomadura luzonensis TaxID=2805427 RepID=A0ABT0FUD0_9ACTN|nr:hypothetical protein [Actinomadura luzonensis]MCK2215778.1 hypothetical protein [Actinomadura luzonensis]